MSKVRASCDEVWVERLKKDSRLVLAHIKAEIMESSGLSGVTRLVFPMVAEAKCFGELERFVLCSCFRLICQLFDVTELRFTVDQKGTR